MNRICELFGIRYPIVQAGMVWTSGWKLCVAASQAGALGMIGAGSMKPEVLAHHIRSAQTTLARSVPFAVNIPLERADAAEQIQTCLDHGVKIVFTSAGNPGLHTSRLKAAGVTVAHVVPTAKHARKCEERGVDAVVCEGTEAGGHNGADELPTFVLVPQVRDAIKLPVIAAGGIVNGRGLAAAFALGADGVQIGTRFAATVEASAHPRYKQAIVEAGETDTVLSMKNVVPVRMIKNPFALTCLEYERRGATQAEVRELLGRKREMAGIFEGDWQAGQFEAGMGAAMIHDILPAAEVVARLVREYNDTVGRLSSL
ncbi:nitronate monooxygenase [candidate division KSB1 bacterium]|nr:nitronate monooxygenase [candidate division KSB1 bacterium]